MFLIFQCSYILPLASFLFYGLHSPAVVDEGSQNIYGTIIDTHRKHRYILQDDSSKKFLLKTEYPLAVGDNVGVYGRVFPSYTFVLGAQKQEFPSSALFSYDKRLYMKGFAGHVSAKHVVITSASSPGFFSLIKKNLRNSFIATYGSGDISGLLLGLMVGDIALFSPSTYQSFIDSGLVHLVAVSGSNILMLLGILHACLFFLPFYLRAGVMLIVLFFYALLCGLDSSVFRATIMSTLRLSLFVFGHSVSVWRIIFYAYILLLLINPYALVYDIGFLLSFFALVAIVTSVRLHKLFQPCSGILSSVYKRYILPSISATLGVLPILLLFFGKANITSFVFSLLTVPFIPLLMLIGCMGLFFGHISIVASFMLDSFLQLAQRGAQHSYVLSFPSFESLLLFVGVYSIVGYLIMSNLSILIQKKD